MLFGQLTGGTKLTLAVCEELYKPYLVNPTADQLRAWLVARQIRVMNVAGSRGSNLTTEQLDAYREILVDALTK